MASPNNMVLFRGVVNETPTVVYEKKSQKPLYVDFGISVERPYLNKGKQLYDYPRIKYAKDGFMKYAALKVGDWVSVCGSYLTDFYEYNGKRVKKQTFLADTISVESKESGSVANKPIVVETTLQLPF